MAVAMRPNGLHHAVSLGTIEVATKPTCSSQYDRSYDSEDENMSRRRLRHTSSTELYPRPSVYSKGDIREQYCLTDRQLHSIERPRRDRFFGCLSRRGAPQSFLGVCVGRRVPSDENLAAYAPFHKYPRYQRPFQQQNDDKSPDSDMDSSYFRRQPASILSSAKTTADGVTGVNQRYSWVGGTPTAAGVSENVGFSNEQSSYHCPTHIGLPNAPMQMPPTTPRTKHVSFARSHTLTSFDDVNLGLRSSGRLKAARSQERLIGGKKPIIASGSIYETIQLQPNIAAAPASYIATLPPTIALHPHPAVIHQHPPHMHATHGHGHSHQHHHVASAPAPIHIHQFLPAYNTELAVGAQVQTEQPISLLSGGGNVGTGRPFRDDMSLGVRGVAGATGVGVEVGVLTCPTQMLAPLSPEVVVVEKKFRNAMKTQATQTEVRKDASAQVLALSPRTLHKVKVVSQGAQTNGLQNGKKLAKSLSEMPNGRALINADEKQFNALIDHSVVYRTQSEEPPKSPLEFDEQRDIDYYEPPPPLNVSSFHTRRLSQPPSAESTPYFPKDAIAFDYESNSLPRRACTFHRESSFSSNSLPRREPLHAHDICKHITECTELMSDSGGLLDFSKPHLLPPPSEYCRDSEDVLTSTSTLTPDHAQFVEPVDVSRRKSMVATMPEETATPFRRDDIRRQSMPIYVKTEKLIDGFGPRTSFRSKQKPKTFIAGGDVGDEQEIFIDFKPHVSARASLQAVQPKYRGVYQATEIERVERESVPQKSVVEECESCRALQAAEQASSASDDDYDVDAEVEVEEPNADADVDAVAEATASDVEAEAAELEKSDHLYENIPNVYQTKVELSSAVRRANLRKRSVSLDEPIEPEEKPIGVSAPPSPCRDELLLVNASTYPSSDSLANDVTRDHSDGIWNESQVTVLTAEQKDMSEGSYTSNMLLTPTSRRRNLLLQHQQRSSVDTDALELEDTHGDLSPTYGGGANATATATMAKSLKPTTTTTLLPPSQTPQQSMRDAKYATLTVPKKAIVVAPTIAVTPSLIVPSKEISPIRSPGVGRRATPEMGAHESGSRRTSDATQIRAESNAKFNNTDISECSTNTDEYATCTDTSKRTPGIKTPPTATSSSSTTQVPVSTQSSQIDRTQGGSSFESASSLYSTRGDILSEDTLQHDERPCKPIGKVEKDMQLKSPVCPVELTKRSPSHSISSTSSGSYNVARLSATTAIITKDVEQKVDVAEKVLIPPTIVDVALGREKPRIKTESISDDERSEVRYSSSGYYESPHDDDHIIKSRRHRLDEERKRRKTTMKLDIEKENLRALTSPIKKQPISATASQTSKDKLPEKQPAIDAASPNRIKRFRPKIRRQFRRSSRDDSTPKRQKNIVHMYGLQTASVGSSEKLLDSSMKTKQEERVELQVVEAQPSKIITSPTKTTTTTTKSASEVCQLKAKSIESLRSVSPGSDSVFYSEADGPPQGSEPHGHCLHCGKGAEGQGSIISALAGDSVESLPYIENGQEHEQDIVKPPSDFADSPVTAKTTQRLYKKMDKRFRSEERYQGGERGRHYKTRQENIRAKSEERSRESVHVRSPHTLRPAGSSPCVLPDAVVEQSQQIIYRGHYDAGRYTRLTDADVWMQLTHQSFERQRDRRPSTESERNFHSKYQVILHRLVQRRCTLEMYHRQRNNSFQLITSNSSTDSLRRKLEDVLKLMLLVWARESHVLSKITSGERGVDKTIVVKSESGEFGFRIHGSKPVVVAAIEPETPAESSGLEVGDIIISVNGVEVLDKHHTEVVKIAHDGCEILELEVARTIGVLMHEQQEPPTQPLFSGYLWRQSGQAKGAPNTKKWVRRWFSLRPDNCLYYYKTENDTQPVGAMIMAKHTIEHCPPEVGKPFAFKIDSGEGIPLYVAADTEEQSARWMKMLKQSTTQGTPWLDNCAHNLYQPPSSIVRPDCFGYLMKLGSRWCGWSKRYCVLKDACLYFYQDANSKTAFGMACLHGYKVTSMSVNASGKKNSFEIIPPEAKLRHYYFCTDSEMDKKRWISALEYSIDRWIKSG